MIDWRSDESHILNNPTFNLEPGESALRELWPGHLWFTTSGTTRRQRRWVGLSKQSLLTSARAVNQHLAVTKNDLWLSALPGFHVGGQGIWARAWLAGIEVIEVAGAWSPEYFVQQAAASGATLSALVPTQIYDLVQRGLKAPSCLRALVVGGGALHPELYRQARNLKWPLLPSFGMTECASQIATASINSLDQQQYPPLQILPHVTCRLDQGGCLELSSAALLTAYAEWQPETGRLEVFDPKKNGWFKSEDRAELVGNFLNPRGRISDQTKVLGELVDLAQLEALLQSQVAALNLQLSATLIATAHPRLQTQIDLVVAIESEKSIQMLAQNLKNAFDQSVLPFERSHNLYVVDKIPRTALGKIARQALFAQLGF